MKIKPPVFTLVLLLMMIALGVCIVVSLGVGAVFVPPERVLQALLRPGDPATDPTDLVIVRDLRLARILLAALVGGGLAAAGAVFQALFRNPLADPYVIGASSGASLGAALAITLGLGWNFGGFGPIPLAAFVGTLLAVLLVYAIAQVGGRISIIGLLLAGASLSTVLSALVSLLMLTNDRDMHEIFNWLMGGFSGRSWDHLWGSGPYLLLGILLLWLLARPLDALACGEELAQTFGLPLAQARFVVIGIASLVTASAVAAGGVIGFVGLVAPHIARMLFGAGHRRVIPGSALIGALLLLLADDLARTLWAPMELPVGIVTALIGGSFFLYLLKTRQREW